MAKYRFFQDLIVTKTIREWYEVDAESLDEAREQVAEVSDLMDCDNACYCDSEELFDDIKEMQNRQIKGIYDEDEEEVK